MVVFQAVVFTVALFTASYPGTLALLPRLETTVRGSSSGDSLDETSGCSSAGLGGWVGSTAKRGCDLASGVRYLTSSSACVQRKRNFQTE